MSTGSSVFNICQSDNYLAQRNYFRRGRGALRQLPRISYSTEFDFHVCLQFANSIAVSKQSCSATWLGVEKSSYHYLFFSLAETSTVLELTVRDLHR